MDTLFSILSLASLAALIVGLIEPCTFAFLFKKRPPTRLKIGLLFSGIMIACLIVSASFSDALPESSQKIVTEEGRPAPEIQNNDPATEMFGSEDIVEDDDATSQPQDDSVDKNENAIVQDEVRAQVDSVAERAIEPSVGSPPSPTEESQPEEDPAAAPTQEIQSAATGHTFYTSSHYRANYYYCDSDEDWKGLSSFYLKSFPSAEQLLAAYPNRILHEPCQ